MDARDLAALALLAGGIKAFKDRSDLLDKEEKKKDPYAAGRAATKAELSAARRKAAREELNRKDRVIGGPRSPLVSSSGDPVTTGTGGYAFTEDIPDSAVSGRFKKGGVVSASKRADGIAQRGKTRGKIV